MNRPPTVGLAGVRPSAEYDTDCDWEVIDRRDGQVIAVKYEPRLDYGPDEPPPLSALGAAEALAGELNATFQGVDVPVDALREEARRLRIEGATV